MTTRTNGRRAARPGTDGNLDGAPPSAPTPAPSPAVAGPGVGVPVRAAAARRRSWRGLLIAVLVIAVGGVLGFAGASMLTRDAQVLAVALDVPQGAVISDADLVVAAVSADPNLSPIPADQRAEVVGLVAQVRLVRGELLTRSQIGAATGFTAGQQLVALPLKPGQLPARGLTPGERVLVVATPGTNTITTTTQGATGAAPVQAVVSDVGAIDAATSLTVVDVRVDAADGPGLARLASTGNLAVILLPAGG